MTMIKHPQVFEITMELYIDADEQARTVRRLVTIPDETMHRLASSHKYPFYLFYDEDGLEVITQYDAIIEIRRIIV
ncbi:hypothetical protein ERK14_06790 [Lactobacillus kunkeei]|nr:hypothetical protein [Apilactobacillus kunkeei]